MTIKRVDGTEVTATQKRQLGRRRTSEVTRSVLLVVASGTFVRTDVPGVLLRVRPAGRSFTLAALVESLLVSSSVFAGVCQTVDAANLRRTLDTKQVPAR